MLDARARPTVQLSRLPARRHRDHGDRRQRQRTMPSTCQRVTRLQDDDRQQHRSGWVQRDDTISDSSEACRA